MHHKSLWLCLAALFLLIPACGEDNNVVPVEQPPDLNEEIQVGWALYHEGDYPAAATQFERVIEHFPDSADGYVGLGWCEIELDHPETALVSLETAIRLGDNSDGVAGLAVVASALGRDSIAVEAASSISDETYLFIGNPRFGYTDLVYIRALGEFHLTRYEDCHESIKILDPDFEIDFDAYDFREHLFLKLERLRGLV